MLLVLGGIYTASSPSNDWKNVEPQALNPASLVRNSERSSFKKCQSQWNWGWNQGLVPNQIKQDARWFGTGIHLVLAEYYTPPGSNGFVRGRNPLETWEEYCAGHNAMLKAGDYYDDDAEYEFVKARELGESMLTEYLKNYGEDPHWEVLMPETRFEANIPFTADQLRREVPAVLYGYGDDQRIIGKIVGTFDMPVRDHSFPKPRIMIVDHKTTNKRENTKHLVKDDQAGTYIAVGTGYLRKLGFISGKEAIDGMIFSYLRKAKPPDKPRNAQGQVLNKDGSVSKVQPAPLFWREQVMRGKANRLRQVERIAEDMEQIAMARQGLLPILKSPGEHCNWCDFSDLCDIDENGDDVQGFIEAVFRRTDPYADHREGAINSKESVSAKKETGVS